jgi:hypothetical protein
MIGAITAGLFSSGVAAATSSYESIATTTVGVGGVTNVTFSSIPSTYKHLQLRILGGTNRLTGAVIDAIQIQFNSDTGSNYTNHALQGDGSTASSFFEGASGDRIRQYGVAGNNGNASIKGAMVTDILDYTNTNKNKTIRSLGGSDANGSGTIFFNSGLWLSTSGVTDIKIMPNTGTLFLQYSSFALYGIKG